MIEFKKDYVEFVDWKDFGIRILYTQKTYGDIREKRKEDVQRDFGLEGSRIVSAIQKHTDRIASVYRDSADAFANTDGLMTDLEDVVLVTKYADCLPVFLCDPTKGVIAAVHSGWQGSFQKIAVKAVEQMQRDYGSKLFDIHVLFGVGISQKNYEVGADFVAKFLEDFASDFLADFIETKEGKLYFDNQGFVKACLLERGIRNENIVCNDLCSYDANFHSYRRDGAKAGRNAALIYKTK